MYAYALLMRATGDILEVGAFVSIRSQDVPSFERYLNLLNTYYGDLSYVTPPLAYLHLH